jgi:LPS-assembly protein
LNTYFDYYIADIEFDRDYSNLFNEIRFRPLPWMSLDLDTQFPVFNSGDDFGFTEINTRLTFMPTDRIEFSVGDRYLADHPFFEDSNLLETRFYARIGDKMGVSALHRYEFDDATLELQQYAVHYDTGSWTLGVGGLIRDHRGEEEFGLMFLATLKDIPQISIPIEIDPSGGGN